MQTLTQYLRTYYVNLDQLATTTSLKATQIERLIAERLAPAPSYVVTTDHRLISCVFGEFYADGAPEGRYFHKDGSGWVTKAHDAYDRLGSQGARAELRTQFKSNFVRALFEINQGLIPLPDTFSASGELNPARADQRFEEAWDALIGGVFNLCVADPSNEASIARKEMLQEHLQKVSARVTGGDSLDSNERTRTLAPIRQYALAAMPFAPPEYPRSSRKRLVEDLAKDLGDNPA